MYSMQAVVDRIEKGAKNGGIPTRKNRNHDYGLGKDCYVIRVSHVWGVRIASDLRNM